MYWKRAGFISFGDEEAVVYAESVSKDGVLTNVFVQRQDGPRVAVIIAEEAWLSDSGDPNVKVLRFARGKRYDGEPGSSRFRIVAFGEHGVPFALPTAGPTELMPEARSFTELIGSPDPVDMAELQWRISVPIAVLVLTILAVPLSRSAPRQGRYGGLAAGVAHIHHLRGCSGRGEGLGRTRTDSLVRWNVVGPRRIPVDWFDPARAAIWLFR